MTMSAFLLDPVGGAPSYNGLATRAVLSALMGSVPRGTPTRPLGANAGVRPGTPTNTVTATATTWTCKPHSGIIDMRGASSAAYLYAVTVAETGTVPAASNANGRIDVLTLVVDDPSTGDGTSVPTPRWIYTTGTPAASPVASSPGVGLDLAYITVPKATTGTPSVQWLPTDWDDTGWVTAGFTAAGGVTLGFQRVRMRGKQVWFYAAGTMGAAVFAAANTADETGDVSPNATILTLPAAYAPALTTALTAGSTGGLNGYAINAGTGVVVLTAAAPNVGSSPYSAGSAWSCGGTWLID